MAGLVSLPGVFLELYTSPMSHRISLCKTSSLMGGSPFLEGEHLQYSDYVLFRNGTSVLDRGGPSLGLISIFQMNE